MSHDLATRLGALDSGDQLDAALSLPDFLRDALWRVGSANLEPLDATGLIVCGMGGSAIGGDLAAAALGVPALQAARRRPRLRRPLVDATRPRDPLLQLLGQHRGDDRLLRRRRGGRSAADRRHDRRGGRRPPAATASP